MIFGSSNPLMRAYQDARVLPNRGSFAITDLKLILFSDVHKGQGDGADDFRRCEPVYDAALAWYFAHDFTLGILGDAEELWECSPGAVVTYHEPALRREASFFHVDPERYVRIFGNHDDLWRWQRKVDKYLGPIFNIAGSRLKVHRAAIIRVSRSGGDDPEVFELLLTHGNQGTIDSDLLAPLSHAFLRVVFHPLQAHVKFSTVTPADTWNTRKEQDTNLRGWAAELPTHPVLIAGHTHQPVFPGSTPEPHLPEVRGVEWIQPDAAFEQAELRRVGALKPEPDDGPPRYFNTGACSFGDGELSGIEIDEGKIRLVKWLRWRPADRDSTNGESKRAIHPGPDREELASLDLTDVLEAVRHARRLQQPQAVAA